MAALGALAMRAFFFFLARSHTPRFSTTRMAFPPFRPPSLTSAVPP